MEQLDIDIRQVEPMQVLCFSGFGAAPEMIAHEKLAAWLQHNGLSHDGQHIFGFNNPDPSPGSPNYGYDVWLKVNGDAEPGDNGRLLDFPGGLYAVTVVKGAANIFPSWQKLAAWLEASSYRMGQQQYLEEHLNIGAEIDEETLELALYLPLSEE